MWLADMDSISNKVKCNCFPVTLRLLVRKVHFLMDDNLSQRDWHCCNSWQKVSQWAFQQVFPSLPLLCARSSSLEGLAHIHLQARQNIALCFLCKTAKFCISCVLCSLWEKLQEWILYCCVKVYLEKLLRKILLAQLGKHMKGIVKHFFPWTILAATTGIL